MGRQACHGIVILLTVLCLSGCAALSYLGYRLFPDHPADVTASYESLGLQAPVLVYLDDLGVPHVQSESERDLLHAVGFLHGRSRFFQMDTIRRYARGRLSELVGEQEVMLGSTSSVDATMRGWGFDRSTRADADALDGELEQLMAAYVEGVNAALERFKPVEYRLLGVEPEPWTVADSLAVGHMVAWGITHNWQQELCRLLLAIEVGHERAERILPPDAWPGDPSLPTVGAHRQLPPSVAPELAPLFPGRQYAGDRGHVTATALPDRMALPRFDGASNGWVLAGERTSSGMPLLAGDPHLPHTLPSLVFQQHLSCPDLDVIGATVPGIPYVIFGHNRSVAWTITAAMADVLDLYVERADPADAGRVLGPEGPEPIDTDIFVIRIREGAGFRQQEVGIRRTARGPLLNDMYPRLLTEEAPLVSLHGIPTRVSGTLKSLREANRARNVRELREAMTGLIAPISAVSAADTSGEIALFSSGTVPVREHHRGTFPAPAWLAKYRWKGFAAPEHLPHATGRGSAFFVNTNNLMVDPAHGPVLFQVDSAPSYRRDRIVERIEAADTHTARSMASIQGDIVVLRARRIVPALLEDLRGETAAERQALEQLGNWDFRARADSTACAIFFAVYREAVRGALGDEIDGEGLRFLLSFRYFTNGVDLWFGDPDHPVWDDRSTESRETRADVVRPAFRRALQELEQRLGSNDPRTWRWGELHYLQPEHALGSRLERFNLPRWPAPGGSATVWKAHFDIGQPEHPFRSLYGPVLRMIVDLADMEHAWWIIDTGSSGWPLSPHYGDQHEQWQQVEHAPMVSDWEEIKAGATAVLTLR